MRRSAQSRISSLCSRPRFKPSKCKPCLRSTRGQMERSHAPPQRHRVRGQRCACIGGLWRRPGDRASQLGKAQRYQDLQRHAHLKHARLLGRISGAPQSSNYDRVSHPGACHFYVTSDGDVLDSIIENHHDSTLGDKIGLVLAANPGLASNGPVCDAGLKIKLPQIDKTRSAETISLWG